VVAEELDGFVGDAETNGRPLTAFVVQTLRDFVSCGSFEHGFVRVLCNECGHERAVPFACKKCGVCSSCAGRRMAETAANLVERVIPDVPVRQWVLSMVTGRHRTVTCSGRSCLAQGAAARLRRVLSDGSDGVPRGRSCRTIRAD